MLSSIASTTCHSLWALLEVIEQSWCAAFHHRSILRSRLRRIGFAIQLELVKLSSGVNNSENSLEESLIFQTTDVFWTRKHCPLRRMEPLLHTMCSTIDKTLSQYLTSSLYINKLDTTDFPKPFPEHHTSWITGAVVNFSSLKLSPESELEAQPN